MKLLRKTDRMDRGARSSRPLSVGVSPTGFGMNAIYLLVSHRKGCGSFGEKSEQTRAAPLAVLPKAAVGTTALPRINSIVTSQSEYFL
jgi:hypothetical protein